MDAEDKTGTDKGKGNSKEGGKASSIAFYLYLYLFSACHFKGGNTPC